MTKESRKCLRLKSQKKYSILLLFYFYFTHFCEEVMITLVEIEWDIRFWLRIPKEKWKLLSEFEPSSSKVIGSHGAVLGDQIQSFTDVWANALIGIKPIINIFHLGACEEHPCRHGENIQISHRKALSSWEIGTSCCEATLLFPCTTVLPVDEIYCIYNLFIDLLLQQQYRYCFFTTYLYCFNFSSLPMFFSSSQYKPAPQRYDHRPNSSDPPLSGPGLGPAVLWLFHLQDVMVGLNMEKLLTWDP